MRHGVKIHALPLVEDIDARLICHVVSDLGRDFRAEPTVPVLAGAADVKRNATSIHDYEPIALNGMARWGWGGGWSLGAGRLSHTSPPLHTEGRDSPYTAGGAVCGELSSECHSGAWTPRKSAPDDSARLEP
jgi:hypothetical protein